MSTSDKFNIIADNFTTITENEQMVYKAGQDSMVDESKIIEKTVSGNGCVVLNDVSEIPHKITVSLSESTSLYVTGKNFFDKSKATRGQALAVKSGGFYADATLFTTDYIRVRPDMNLAVSPWAAYSWGCCYDINKTFIGATINIADNFYYYATLQADTAYVRLTGRLSDIDTFQIEEGTMPTEYETYRDGVVYSGNYIEALSPTTRIYSDSDVCTLTVGYWKSYGAEKAYNFFWDGYQVNGTRTNYSFAFYGLGWNDRTFYPKYDIAPVGANGSNLFASNKCNNIKKRLEECGVVLDCSQNTQFQNAFNYMWTTELPEIDASKATTLASTFAYSSKLVSVDKFIFGTTNTYSGNFVFGCTALENFIAEGTIAISGFDFSYCTKLNQSSLISIVDCLSTTTTGMSITFSQTAVDNAFSSGGQWVAICGERSNWTITLV